MTVKENAKLAPYLARGPASMGKRKGGARGNKRQAAFSQQNPIHVALDADVVVDGSLGEGGGQIVRASLALSAITGKSVRIDKIRHSRPKPGLAAQHLAGARTVAEVAGAALSNAELQSKSIHLQPQGDAGTSQMWVEHDLPLQLDSVKTAGSTALVLQAALPATLRFLPSAPTGTATAVISGGTIAMAAPLSDYIEHVLSPNLRLFGIEMSCNVLKHGFFPRGGGELEVTLRKSPDLIKEGSNMMSLRPVELSSRGPVIKVCGRVVIAGSVPDDNGVSMCIAARKRLRTRLRSEQKFEGSIDVVMDRVPSEQCCDGTVAALTVWAVTGPTTLHEGTVFGASGLVGRSLAEANAIAEGAADELCDDLALQYACVDSHMADQLAMYVPQTSYSSSHLFFCALPIAEAFCLHFYSLRGG